MVLHNFLANSNAKHKNYVTTVLFFFLAIQYNNLVAGNNRLQKKHEGPYAIITVFCILALNYNVATYFLYHIIVQIF